MTGRVRSVARRTNIGTQDYAVIQSSSSPCFAAHDETLWTGICDLCNLLDFAHPTVWCTNSTRFCLKSPIFSSLSSFWLSIEWTTVRWRTLSRFRQIILLLSSTPCLFRS